MQPSEASIIHINVTDFAAAVTIAKNQSLSDSVFVIALEASNRSVVITPSHRAWEEGIRSGMPLRMAQRLLPSLQVLPLDSKSIAKADQAIATIVQTYSPQIQCDRNGHVYLDMHGTTRLFGPVVDSAVRIRKEIAEQLNLEASVAVASNKLVAKIGTRTTRPSGLIQVREGEEAAFLAQQDVDLLSGVGVATSRLLAVAGITQIGQIASLDDQQVLAFLGKRGLALRDAARGLDKSPLHTGLSSKRVIQRKVSFATPLLEQELLQAAVVTATEDAALSMRTESMGCSKLYIQLSYTDGKVSEATCRTKDQWAFDQELVQVAWRAAQQARNRRVRLLGFVLHLAQLSPLMKSLDLIFPEGAQNSEKLQQAVDTMRKKFGVGILTHANALPLGPSERLLPALQSPGSNFLI